MQFNDPYDHYFCIEGSKQGGFVDVRIRIARATLRSLRDCLLRALEASKIDGAELLSIKDVTEDAREIPIYSACAICDRVQDVATLKHLIAQTATRWASQRGLLVETKIPVKFAP